MLPNTIRSSYKPLQPTINGACNNVAYHERQPHDALKNFIYCYWQLKTTKPLSTPLDYRVVADGCVDVFFDTKLPTQSFVMGFSHQYTKFPLEQSFDYVGIRFQPSAFPLIFQFSADELTDRTLELDLISSKLSTFIRQSIPHNANLENIAELLDAYFTQLLAKLDFNFDPRLCHAMETIFKYGGVVKAGSDLNAGISQRQLRRIFNHYIGTTPKTFSRVVRFQNILRINQSPLTSKNNALFHAHGFYDQPHLIKDFKNFSGTTPRKIFL